LSKLIKAGLGLAAQKSKQQQHAAAAAAATNTSHLQLPPTHLKLHRDSAAAKHEAATKSKQNKQRLPCTSKK